ncbi:hypothetical protein FN846DRAFT_902329 [Sphaerosporella brunnea]|uniref:Uncharacterized protein n=1 Tax=Sphaerosporella brunnea TaxID=1250544 RepID=A0A5J5FAE9_9PEZI|nr:hypothetical protein FN846DRAFT_902329 [Sphaerosporella brunnea]
MSVGAERVFIGAGYTMMDQPGCFGDHVVQAIECILAEGRSGRHARQTAGRNDSSADISQPTTPVPTPFRSPTLFSSLTPFTLPRTPTAGRKNLAVDLSQPTPPVRNVVFEKRPASPPPAEIVTIDIVLAFAARRNIKLPILWSDSGDRWRRAKENAAIMFENGNTRGEDERSETNIDEAGSGPDVLETPSGAQHSGVQGLMSLRRAARSVKL